MTENNTNINAENAIVVERIVNGVTERTTYLGKLGIDVYINEKSAPLPNQIDVKVPPEWLGPVEVSVPYKLKLKLDDESPSTEDESQSIECTTPRKYTFSTPDASDERFYEWWNRMQREQAASIKKAFSPTIQPMTTGKNEDEV